MKTLRIALFGCGKMGLQHLDAIASVPGTEVVGIADPALDTDAVAGRLGPGARLFADPRELLEVARPDVVHVVTPQGTHGALARLAIEAGCHVYVEKPFTPTRAEAEELLALAAEHGVKVCPGHQYLFEAPALGARAALPQIGSLVHVESYCSFRQVRRNFTPVEQVKDILPHAVYPLVEQLQAGTGLTEDEIALAGLDVSPEGEVHAIVRLGSCAGLLTVTLRGRPIEQYQHLVGTRGWIRADYITGATSCLAGPGTGLGMLLAPYRRAAQAVTGATAGFLRRFVRRQASYPGLPALVGRFYASVRDGSPSPVSPRSILETVGLCERIGAALDRAEVEAEARARERLERAAVPAPSPERRPVLVTGGTGVLGRRVAAELRDAGVPVRVLARRWPRYADRLPGVGYVLGDLSRPLDPSAVAGVECVVHCAAETRGGASDHQRNSIEATRHVVEAAARAGAKVVHVSSLAVLEPGRRRGRALDEASPVDADAMARGPYVWGKAESERLARRLGEELGVPVAVIRPGPLVDYDAFEPPGRLGRELGPLFVAVGGRKAPLGVCDVGTAARVIRSYVLDFASAPRLLNLVEAPAPARRDLARRLREARPDLTVVWLPDLMLRALNAPLMAAQRVALGRARTVDLHAAFASETCATTLAATMIQRAGAGAAETREGHGTGPA